jgi:hypothetical protein
MDILVLQVGSWAWGSKPHAHKKYVLLRSFQRKEEEEEEGGGGEEASCIKLKLY